MKFTFLLVVLSINIHSFSQDNIIHEINFVNTKRMNTNFMSNLITTKLGTKLDSTIIEKDIVLLNRLNGISKAEFEVVKIEDYLYVINYKIIENFTLIPTLNAGNSDKGGFYRIGLYEFNLFGRNIILGGFYQFNEFNSFGLNFSAPTLFSNKTGIEMNIQKLSSNEPLFIDNGKANYQYTNTGFEILGIYQFDYKNKFKLGYSLFKEEYNYLEGITNLNIPQKLDINKNQIKLQYNFDNLKYDYYLLDGFRSNLNLQFVISENNFQEKFAIGWNDFLYFKNLKNKSNWASRLRLGLATNTKSPFAPFSVDNNLNIRGVGNIIDRGTGTMVLNTELRQTFFERKWFVFQGNAFIDAGSWRNPGGTLNDFITAKNFRIYPGLGIRFIHKTIFNAVFRLDYGYGITKNASKGLVFGIGQYF